MNVREKARLERLAQLLTDAHDVLEGMADSDIDHFEDEDEEREAVPAQYAARKVMEAVQGIENMLGGA